MRACAAVAARALPSARRPSAPSAVLAALCAWLSASPRRFRRDFLLGQTRSFLVGPGRIERTMDPAAGYASAYAMARGHAHMDGHSKGTGRLASACGWVGARASPVPVCVCLCVCLCVLDHGRVVTSTGACLCGFAMSRCRTGCRAVAWGVWDTGCRGSRSARSRACRVWEACRPWCAQHRSVRGRMREPGKPAQDGSGGGGLNP